MKGGASSASSSPGSRRIASSRSKGFEPHLFGVVRGCWLLPPPPGGGGSARGEPVLASPSPPHPVVASRRRPSPGGGGRTWARDSSPAVSRRCGEGAERPGLARCCCRVTVSTKQTTPRSRFPRAGRLAALASGLAGGPARPCGRSGRRNVLTLSVAVPSPGARRAGGCHPSTSPGTPGLSSARASSLDHSPPPSRNVDPTPSPPTGWGDYGTGSSSGGEMTLLRLERTFESEGWVRKLVWLAADCEQSGPRSGSDEGSRSRRQCDPSPDRTRTPASPSCAVSRSRKGRGIEERR